ncbi:MAG: pyruvate formate lyase family protein, partial [Bacteroidales bacterium]|nr:pyruvate formate lyase family protein [Bacteroidales bacterium]
MKAAIEPIMEEELTYKRRIEILREKKIRQTEEKIKKEGGLDEDDYGRVVPPDDFEWKIIPNHSDGSFYGYKGWAENFSFLMGRHPVFVDPVDALAGRWMFFLSRMKGKVWEGSIWNPDYDYSHLQPGFDKYNIICGIGCDAHLGPDYRIGLKLGWGGLLEKVRYYRKKHGKERSEFYDAEEKIILGIQTFIRRTIEVIKEKETKEKHPVLKKNLQDMVEVNEWLVENSPRTLRETCQWMAWYGIVTRTYNRDGAGGQLDEWLKPYYEKDVAEGKITDDEAIFYIACLLLNDTKYYQLGGPGPDGKDLTSHISYLILEAANLLNISLNLTICVHDSLDSKFFLKSIRYLYRNKSGWPRYSGSESLVKGFVNNGYSVELARTRAAVGCNWVSLPGLEYPLNDIVKINVAKVFEVAYHEMMEENTGKPGTARLWNIYEKHLKNAVDFAAKGIDFHLKHQVYNEPELVLNLLCHGPVERGLDLSNGGVDYYNIAIDGAGLATTADSFAALEQRIEIEGKTNWQGVTKYLKNNYEGIDGESFRMMMKHSEHYGYGGSLGDKWAIRISKLFTKLVKEQDKNYDCIFIPGWFSWALTILFGKAVGTTPDGRRAKEPISHGANPTPGFRKDSA